MLSRDREVNMSLISSGEALNTPDDAAQVLCEGFIRGLLQAMVLAQRVKRLYLERMNTILCTFHKQAAPSR